MQREFIKRPGLRPYALGPQRLGTTSQQHELELTPVTKMITT
jgi:hypothetical protein